MSDYEVTFRKWFVSTRMPLWLMSAARDGWRAAKNGSPRVPDPNASALSVSAYLNAYDEAWSHSRRVDPLPVKQKKQPQPRPAKPKVSTQREQQQAARREVEYRQMQERMVADRERQEQQQLFNEARAQIWAIAEHDEKNDVKLDSDDNPILAPKGKRDEHGAIRRLSELRALRDDILTVGGLPQAVKLYLSERRRVAKDEREERRLNQPKTHRVGSRVFKL